MKKSLILAGMLSIGYAYAQEYKGRVGINTDTPSATLNVKTKDDSQSPKNLELENQAGTKLVTVLNNGKVGIGTTTPVTPLVVKGEILSYKNDGVANHTGIGVFGSSFSGSAFRGDIEHFLEQWAKGVNDHSKIEYSKKDDYIVNYMGYDYKGTRDHLQPGEWTAPYGGTGMGIYADGDHTLDSKPGRIEFRTTSVNSIENKLRMIIANNGNVGIGNVGVPTNILHIKADANPLKLEGLQAGSGSALVVDADGVVKKGSAVTIPAVEVGSTVSMKCDATNRGKINFVPNDSGSDIFGVCLRNADGNYYWGLLTGGGNLTTGGEIFGQ